MVKNLICGIITLSLAIGYLIEAAALPTSALADQAGASGFPMLIGWTMVAASGLLVIRSAIGVTRHVIGERPRERANASGENGDSEIWTAPGRTAAAAAGLVIIAALYLLILPVLGYLVSLFLMIVASALYHGKPLSWKLALVAVGGAVFLWVLFTVILDLPLPAGFWAESL